MKISARLKASTPAGHITFSLEDLNVTQQAWDKMPDTAKRTLIQQSVDALPEHPFWVLDKFTETPL